MWKENYQDEITESVNDAVYVLFTIYQMFLVISTFAKYSNCVSIVYPINNLRKKYIAKCSNHTNTLILGEICNKWYESPLSFTYENKK